MKLKLPHPHIRHSTSSHTHVKEKQYRKSDPAHTWHVLLILAGMLFVLTIAFHGFLYMKVNRGEVKESTAEVSTETIHEAKLSFILGFFEARTQAFEERKLVPPTLRDPSL